MMNNNIQHMGLHTKGPGRFSPVFLDLSAMDKDEMSCHPLFNEFMPAPASKQDYEQVLALHEFQPTDENQFFYTCEGVIDERRYIFSFDVSRFFKTSPRGKNESLKQWLGSRREKQVYHLPKNRVTKKR